MTDKKGRETLLPARWRQIIQDNKNWIALSTLFFCLGVVVSLLPFQGAILFVSNLLEGQMDALEDIAEQIVTRPAAAGIFYLFFNNLVATIYVVVSGILAGLPTVFSLFVNGAAIGMILNMPGFEGNVLALVVLGILPHGIFELPAFFLSAAFGLKIGYHLFFPLPEKGRFQSIIYIWREFTTLFPLILIMLLLAAIIEITITPHLMGMHDFFP